MLSTVVMDDCCGEGLGWYGRGAQVKMALRVDCKVAAGMKDDSGAGK